MPIFCVGWASICRNDFLISARLPRFWRAIWLDLGCQLGPCTKLAPGKRTLVECSQINGSRGILQEPQEPLYFMGQSVVPVDFPLNHSSFEVHTVHTDRELEGKSWRCGREYFYTYLSLCTSHPIPLYFHILYQTCFFFSSNPRSSLSLSMYPVSVSSLGFHTRRHGPCIAHGTREDLCRCYPVLKHAICLMAPWSPSRAWRGAGPSNCPGGLHRMAGGANRKGGWYPIGSNRIYMVGPDRLGNIYIYNYIYICDIYIYAHKYYLHMCTVCPPPGA